MNVEQVIKTRHASKAYDKTRKLTPEQEQQIFDLLRYTPSSVNSQPWHFFALVSEEAKQKILPALMEPNIDKVLNASMVIVFTTKTEITEAHLSDLLAQEQADGRFTTEEQKQAQDQSRHFFVGYNSQTPQKQREWMARQTYISLGFLLLGAATMGLDTTPIEGFFVDKMDESLRLGEQNLTSVVVATIGYHNENDFNGALPKSRFGQDQVITRL